MKINFQSNIDLPEPPEPVLCRHCGDPVHADILNPQLMEMKLCAMCWAIYQPHEKPNRPGYAGNENE